MTDEEKKAIDFYKSIIDEWHTHYDNCGFEEKSIKRLETILNLISKLQKENEKQEKVIDEMATELDIAQDRYEYMGIDDIKEHFYRKVKENEI